MENRKEKLLAALNRWIAKRPGLDPRNYISSWNDSQGIACYRSESRSITQDRHHAQALLDAIAWRDAITADDIMEAAKHSFSGRLSITETPEGFKIDYCTGQYWPTEYRRAVCSVLSSAFWDYLRDDCNISGGDNIRRAAMRELPRGVALRWFR